MKGFHIFMFWQKKIFLSKTFSSKLWEKKSRMIASFVHNFLNDSNVNLKETLFTKAKQGWND